MDLAVVRIQQHHDLVLLSNCSLYLLQGGGALSAQQEERVGCAMTLPALHTAGLIFRLVDRLAGEAWGCMESAWDIMRPWGA